MIVAESWITTLLRNALRFWGNCSKTIWSLLTTAPSEFKDGAVWEVMVNINDAVKYIAYALLVIFFGIGVIKEITNVAELKRPENVFRLFFRYIIAKTLITYVMDMLNSISKIGIGIIKEISDSSEWVHIYGGRGGGLPEEISSLIEDAGFWTSVPLSIITILGFLIIVALSIVAVMTVYGRFFKIYIYTAIAPIPLSTIAGEPTQATGWQFIKSYIGICFEGAVIGIACIIYTKLASTGTISSMFGASSSLGIVSAYIVEVIFNMLIMLGTIKGASQIVHEMTNL